MRTTLQGIPKFLEIFLPGSLPTVDFNNNKTWGRAPLKRGFNFYYFDESQAYQEVPEWLEHVAEEAIGSSYGPAGGKFASKDRREVIYGYVDVIYYKIKLPL